jgi:ATP synthase F1 gamma subunit
MTSVSFTLEKSRGQGPRDRETPQGRPEHLQDHQDDADDRDSEIPEVAQALREHQAVHVKIREVVTELASSVQNVEHPLLRRPGETEGDTPSNRTAVIVLTSDRGSPGAYNGSVFRTAGAHLRRLDEAGVANDLYVSGKKGISYFKYQKQPLAGKVDQQDPPRYADIERYADTAMRQFTAGEIDAVYVVYMNFVSPAVTSGGAHAAAVVRAARVARAHCPAGRREESASQGRRADAKRRGEALPPTRSHQLA